MANDYYPDFYRRKRQRDHVFVVLRNVFLLVLVCALGAALAYLLWRSLIAPRSTEPGATPTMADERQNLETKQLLSDAGKQNFNSGTVAQENAQGLKVDLQALPYAPSFPLVQVGIGEGSPAAAGAQVPGADAAGAPGTEGATDQVAAPPPAEGNEAIIPEAPAVETPTAEENDAAQKAAKAEEQKEAAAKAEAKKAEAKKAEQAKLDQKKKEDAKKAEQAKKEEPKEKAAPPAKSGGYTYRVYAGTKQSREAAEKLKNEVAATGVSATIVQNGGDFLLLVGTLEDFESARALKDKLVSSGFSGAFTTRKSK